MTIACGNVRSRVARQRAQATFAQLSQIRDALNQFNVTASFGKDDLKLIIVNPFTNESMTLVATYNKEGGTTAMTYEQFQERKAAALWQIDFLGKELEKHFAQDLRFNAEEMNCVRMDLLTARKTLDSVEATVMDLLKTTNE